MFEAMWLLLLREMFVASVARFLGERDTRLWRMLGRHVDEARESKDLAGVVAVNWNGLATRNVQADATVFANSRKGDFLFAAETKEDNNWGRFADDLRAHAGNPVQIKQASMDRSRYSHPGAKCYCPKSTLVFKQFPVSKRANEAVDKVYRRESWVVPWCGGRRKKAATFG